MGLDPFPQLMQMLDVLTSTYDNINDKTITALLLFDLNKAFDTVQHDILLRILKRHQRYRPKSYCLIFKE